MGDFVVKWGLFEVSVWLFLVFLLGLCVTKMCGRVEVTLGWFAWAVLGLRLSSGVDWLCFKNLVA